MSADRPVAEIWVDESPQNALASLQVGVSRLRAMIEPDRAPRASASRLVSAAGGYAVRAEVGEVDAWAFEAAAEECLAADGVAVRVDRADAALAWWRGEPYLLGADLEPLRLEADRLRELRVAVIEAQAEALLALGQHDRVSRGFADLAASHPFREQLWGILALAQYRSGRQAEALATIRTLRQRLDDDLGVDLHGADPQVGRPIWPRPQGPLSLQISAATRMARPRFRRDRIPIVASGEVTLRPTPDLLQGR